MKSVLAFGLCLILFGIFAGDRGVPALLEARRQAKALGAQISTLRAENARLRVQAIALRDDASTIENVARETLGLTRPGEIVVIRRR